jgi:hypothetical protein
MSQKPTSTKGKKVAAKLVARQKQFDNGKWGEYYGYNRPGGTSKQGDHQYSPVVFHEAQDAIKRIAELGFSNLLSGTKSIKLDGTGSLGGWKAADYLVNKCGYKFMKVGA